MKNETRERLFLPLIMPLTVLMGVGAVVAGFAFIMLFNTREAAVALAAVMAGGILFAIALLSTRGQELDAGRRGFVVFVGALPVILGIIFAFNVTGTPEAQLNINREPHGAEGGIPDDFAGDTVTFVGTEFAFDPAQTQVTDSQGIGFVLDNQGTVEHTWVIEGLEDEFKLETSSGGESDAGVFEVEPGEYTFYCDVPGHRSAGMEGTLTVQ